MLAGTCLLGQSLGWPDGLTWTCGVAWIAPAAAAWRLTRQRHQMLIQAMQEIAAGRLMHQLPQHGSADWTALATEFNRMGDYLRQQIGQVVQASGQVLQAGDDMSLSAQSLAIRTEEQSRVITQTSHAVDDVLQAVRTTSDMAANVDSNSQSLCDQADASCGVVDRTVQAIGRIRHSTSQMTQALQAIDELTFQTNILALNAAIEAARAGPAGRGFAVVAGEVRALAGRTADAARQIKRMIEQANTEVAAGVNEVESVQTLITRIGSSFREVSQQMRDVSQSNLVQSAAIGLISQGLVQLSEITEANSRLVVASVGSAEQLRGSAQDLTALVDTMTSEADAPGRPGPIGASQPRMDEAEVGAAGIEFF